jgi:hypothetical protein
MERTWTLAEANAALPKVREMAAEGRRIQSEARDIQDNLEDLRIVWGDAVLQAPCPDHAEFGRLSVALHECRQAREFLLLKFAAMGVEPKDLDEGLVDFPARIGPQQVYLCWRWGEPAVAWYHSVSAGVRGRKPVP